MSFLPEIVKASLSLEESIEGTRGFFFPWAKPNPIVERRWQRWQETAGAGDDRKFNNRLRWSRLRNRGYAHAVLSGRATSQNRSSWVEIFQKVTDRFGLDLVPSIPYLQEPVPFEELCVPFIEVARQGLQLPQRWGEIALPEIEAVLCRQLLGWLVSLAGRALLEQFSLFRLAQQPMMARLIFHLPDYQGKQIYQDFISKQKHDRMGEFFRTYPVLARLMSRVTELWIDATQEFIDRLDRDYELFCTAFGISGKIAKLQPELGDPHNGGRTVGAIEFSSGQKVIYKPRSLAAEEAFSAWVAWVNSLEGVLDLRTARVIDRGDYGWMEFVEAKPCNDRDGASNFYHRLGELLALLYILEGNDCHYENLIAQGEYPILVDLETLLHPEFQETVPLELRLGNDALYLAQENLRRSVLRVGLLPRWEVSGNQTIDLSAMGIGSEQEVARVPKWEDINTDKMRLTQAPLFANPSHSSPIVEGETANPLQFSEAFVSGFCQLWQAVAQNKAQAPLDCLQNLPLRTIFRPSQTYGNILENALRPQYLRHGLDFSIELERLARPLLWRAKPHPLWALIQAEIRSLWQFDLPFFRSNSSSTHLWEGDNNPQPLIPNCFVCPSAQTVAQNLDQLTEQNLEEQLGLIRSSLYAVETSASAPTVTPQSFTWQEMPPATPQEAIAEALTIGKELEKRAFYGKDGSIAWIGLGLVPESDKFRLQPVEYSLYDGSVGIALFLAALYGETKDDRWQRLALGAIQPLEFLLNNQALLPLFIDSVGIGGAVGLGSILYGLSKISQFLNEKSLLVTADRVARLITPEIIKKDVFYDVLAGSGGAILSLLALYRITGQAHVLDRALQCGNHLLEQRVPTATGHRVWQTPDLAPLTGFSHGAAGIAYALLELYRVTKRSEFLRAAQDGIAFEEAVFIPGQQNYPDFRFADSNSCMNSWCHGASGIALARLGSLPTLDNTDLRTAIDRAVNTTTTAGMQPIDHLCCGNLGRIETLLTAAQILDREDLNHTVKHQLANLLHRARQSGGFYLFPHHPKAVFNPGFFQGMAGIGYTLLRIAKPGRYPSVLLWQ